MPDFGAFVLNEDDHTIQRHDFEANDSTAALEIANLISVSGLVTLEFIFL